MKAFRCLALFVLLLPLIAMAEEAKEKDNQTQKWTVTLGLVTRHVDPSDNTNESSRLLGLSYSNWVAARFSNSYDEASVFCGRRLQTKELHHPRYTDFFYSGKSICRSFTRLRRSFSQPRWRQLDRAAHGRTRIQKNRHRNALCPDTQWRGLHQLFDLSVLTSHKKNRPSKIPATPTNRQK